MARFGTGGRVCGNTARIASIGADFGRIVALFRGKGKPDPARKSRLFNNLGCPRRNMAEAGDWRFSAFGIGRRPCGMPQGYDSHSPRQDFSALSRKFTGNPPALRLKTLQERPS
jgi:hypothetical protein